MNVYLYEWMKEDEWMSVFINEWLNESMNQLMTELKNVWNYEWMEEPKNPIKILKLSESSPNISVCIQLTLNLIHFC